MGKTGQPRAETDRQTEAETEIEEKGKGDNIEV